MLNTIPTIFMKSFGDGTDADAGCTKTLACGRKVRLLAERKFGKLYWSADAGDTFSATKEGAVIAALNPTLAEQLGLIA